MTISGTRIFDANTITQQNKHPMPNLTGNGGADTIHSQFETTLIPERYYDCLVKWLIDENLIVAD